ncbi:carbohydrate binding family 9 domain-containing protein [Aliikangiella maris]|uniref:DUF5916 domain-containing protein n=2 Tax=Aliikangiella maris TaxID=3162458 RepID=A0ABV2BR53_9GAMM
MQATILKKFLGIICSLFCCSYLVAESQVTTQKQQFKLPHIDSHIEVDGILDEAAWAQALVVSLDYETQPGENTKPPVTTEVLLFDNGINIYVAFKAFDPQPKAIRNYLTDRDNIWETDLVGIKFDTFGESRKAFQFFTNALGVQADSIQEDFKGDNSNWDTIWDSVAQITEWGYLVEMSIPLKALRFPASQTQQKWAFEAIRFYPRDVRHRIANTPVNRDISCNICQFDQLVGLKNAKPSKNLNLIPTLVTNRVDHKDQSIDEWNEGDVEHEFGLDLRWGITQDIYLNATLNPDFSQVEADSPQLDVNNPFSIFVEEKRPFFLDGVDYFETNNNLVNTRNIIAPDYGLKVSGQTNGHSFGLMSTNDEHTSYLLPSSSRSEVVRLNEEKSENQVLRYSYDLGNKNNIGILHTRRTADEYHNKVTAIDAKYWLDQYHSMTLQYMSADTQNTNEIAALYELPKTQTGDALTVSLKHESRNWRGYIDYIEYDKNFRADLGFISQVNFDKTIVGLSHRWYPENNDSWWKKIIVTSDWDHTFDNDGLKLEEELELHFGVEGNYQSLFETGIIKRRKYWNGYYFNERHMYSDLTITPIRGLKLYLSYEWGDNIDFANTRIGKQTSLIPEISWQINTNWQTSLDYRHVNFDIQAGELFTAKLSNFRITYLMNVRSFLRFTMQQTDISRTIENYTIPVNATSKSVSSQFLYSYKINPQTLFFAGYADEGYQDDNLTHIEKTGRSVFMKFSYAWQL